MKFGLSTPQLDKLKKIFISHPEVEEVIIFGSRAKNTQKVASDIDFALKGSITLALLAKIKYELEEETSLPYFFDVVNYQTLNNRELKKH